MQIYFLNLDLLFQTYKHTFYNYSTYEYVRYAGFVYLFHIHPSLSFFLEKGKNPWFFLYGTEEVHSE